MSKTLSKIALSFATTALCATVVLAGTRRASAHEALFTSAWNCAADVSSLCASHGWGPMDTGTAILIRALIGAACISAVTIPTARPQWASFPARAGTSSAARAVAWTPVIFLYLIAINYSGEAIIGALNSDGADEDFVRIALPFLAGGVFWIASIWAAGRILAGSPTFRASCKLRHCPARRVLTRTP